MIVDLFKTCANIYAEYRISRNDVQLASVSAPYKMVGASIEVKSNKGKNYSLTKDLLKASTAIFSRPAERRLNPFNIKTI